MINCQTLPPARPNLESGHKLCAIKEKPIPAITGFVINGDNVLSGLFVLIPLASRVDKTVRTMISMPINSGVFVDDTPSGF